MPTATPRRHRSRAHAGGGEQAREVDITRDVRLLPRGGGVEVGMEGGDVMDDEEDQDEEEGEGGEEEGMGAEDRDDEDEDLDDPDPSPVPFPPPGLKEISSLASWTVSTAKPGNGVAALRSPDPAHFWQSDGPQPHLLSIHFFKLVSLVSIRVLLDFDNDESYTPTKIQFLAGMGVHDVQEFAEMSFHQPNGWHEVDFSHVGAVQPEDGGEEEEEAGGARRVVDWSKRPVLRAFLVQVRILENHQNGKDTHLRAVQLFARDDAQQQQQQTRSVGVKQKAAALPMRTLLQGRAAKRGESDNIKRAEWMMEPDLR